MWAKFTQDDLQAFMKNISKMSRVKKKDIITLRLWLQKMVVNCVNWCYFAAAFLVVFLQFCIFLGISLCLAAKNYLTQCYHHFQVLLLVALGQTLPVTIF